MPPLSDLSFHLPKPSSSPKAFYPSYSNIDPYRMAACSIDTAIRNLVAAGADPDYIALLDNFCWCSSNEPERLWQLKQAAKACHDYAIAYMAPFVSGKDSMFNDFKGFDHQGNPIKISVPPTLLISSFSVITNATKTVSLDLKSPGDLIYLLGSTHDELGGSQFNQTTNQHTNSVPKVNAKLNLKTYQAIFNCTQKDLINSSISLTRGGLATALSKTAIAGMLGIKIDLTNISGSSSSPETTLFSETQGRVLVSISPQNKNQFETLAKNIHCNPIGQVTDSSTIAINTNKSPQITLDLDQASSAYKSSFKDF